MNIRQGVSLGILSVFLTLYPFHAKAAIKVIPQPGANPVSVQKVEKAVNSFNDLLFAEMKVTLTQDVDVFICADPASYRQTLVRELRFSGADAERHSRLSSGMSSARMDSVALKFDPSYPGNDNTIAYMVTCHELFHQVQGQLAEDKNAQAMKWLREGTADYVGVTIAERVGYQSKDKWKLDTLNILRRSQTHVSPSQIIHTSLDAWAGLMENKLYPYQMSDLMVFYLVSQVKGNPYEAIAEYFRLTAHGKNDDENFNKAFGMSLKQFLTGFEAWFIREMADTAQVEIIARGNVPVDQLADFEKGVNLSRQYFREHWGTDLRSEVRFIVVPDKAVFTDALVQEMGIDRTQAAERAKLGGWNSKGSTTIVDLSYYRSAQGRTFGAAENMISRLMDEAGAAKAYNDLSWFSYGGRNAFAAHIVTISSGYGTDNYERSLKSLVKKTGSFPSLVEISTRQGWETAKKKYGPSTSAVANLAALYLFNMKGVEAYHQWLILAAKTGNAEKALLEVYGLTTQDVDQVIHKLLVNDEAA